MQPFNLVLSGGGIRGVAHLGVIKALQERGMVLEAISGTSSGALVGAFIAAGYTPEETLSIVKENGLLQLARPRLNGGLLSLNKMGELLLRYFPENSFERLNVPLIVVASDLTEGHSDFFSHGELITPLLASASIPILFEPIWVESHQLVDGGVINNLPVEPFLEEDITLIGVNVNPWENGQRASGFFQVMERLVSLHAWQSVKQRKRHCHLFLEPAGLSRFGIFDNSYADQIFELGYQYTKSRLSVWGQIPYSTTV